MSGYNRDTTLSTLTVFATLGIVVAPTPAPSSTQEIAEKLEIKARKSENKQRNQALKQEQHRKPTHQIVHRGHENQALPGVWANKCWDQKAFHFLIMWPFLVIISP